MINLIKNELIKIFKKKSIFIIILISFFFVCFNNVIYKYVNNILVDDFEYSEEVINAKKEELKNFTIITLEDYEYYAELNTSVDTYELLSKYNKNDWKYYVVLKDAYPYISNYNRSKIIDKNEEAYKENYKKYTDFVKLIDSMDDWKDYARHEISSLENENKELKEYLSKVTTLEEKDALNLEIKDNERSIIRLNLRIEKNIPYSNDYLNIALDVYDPNLKSYEEYSKEEKDTLKQSYNEFETKKEYYQLATSNAKKLYAINNKKDIESFSSLDTTISNFVGDYGIYILIISISTAGAIVSSEFDKGTIKNLLIRPYKRSKILLSKYIACLITTLLAILILLALELIVGGIIFGYGSLSNSVIVYSFTKNSIIEVNVIKYLIDTIISALPMFILLTTLGFAVSTIFNSTPLGIVLPMLGYFGGNIINLIIESYNVKILHFFVTPNWDLSNFLYGNIGNYDGSSIIKSLIICLVYFIIMIIPSFIIFKKRNIKNI